MFTIKVYTPTGHYVRECKRYAFVRGTLEGDIALSIDRIVGDDGQDGDPFAPVGQDTIYIMNASGKTVDKFEAYTPDHPKRLALDPSLRPADYDAKFAEAIRINSAKYPGRPDLLAPAPLQDPVAASPA